MNHIIATKYNYFNLEHIRKIEFSKGIFCFDERHLETCHVVTWADGSINLVSGEMPDEDGNLYLCHISGSYVDPDLYKAEESLKWEGSSYKVIRDKDLYDRISELKPIPVCSR